MTSIRIATNMDQTDHSTIRTIRTFLLSSKKVYSSTNSFFVNKNRIFLPFLSSEWIPSQVLPDWKMGTIVASFSVWNRRRRRRCRRSHSRCCRRHGRCCRRRWWCCRTPLEIFLLRDPRRAAGCCRREGGGSRGQWEPRRGGRRWRRRQQ